MRPFFTQDRDGNAVLDLRREGEARRPTLAEGALPALTDAERDEAVRTWRGRMVNEHVSAQVWAGLLPQLLAAAVPPGALVSVASAIADELRHAEQCSGVVLALGGQPIARLPAIVPVPKHEDVPPLEAALRNVISVGCLSETIAVSVIRAEQAEIEAGPFGEILASILADEVQHARVGWSLLGVVAPLLDDDARARIDAWLVDALAHLVAWEVPKLPVVLGRRPELAQAGVCDGLAARGLFEDTVTQVIVPGLERAGLAGRAAWDHVRHA